VTVQFRFRSKRSVKVKQ